MKRFFLIVAILIGLTAGILWVLSPKPVTDLDAPGKYCAFCDCHVLNHQKFYEDDLVIALCTYRPISAGHCLIIPKRHVLRYEQLTDVEMLRVSQVIKKVNAAANQIYHNPAYIIYQKNGYQAGQSVPHVHFHYLPRQNSDNCLFTFFIQAWMAELMPAQTYEEMQPSIEALHNAISTNLRHCLDVSCRRDMLDGAVAQSSPSRDHP